MDESYGSKWRYLCSYSSLKMKLRRLEHQRRECIALRGKTSELGTVVQSGKTSDPTSDIATRLLENIDKATAKMRDIYAALSAISDYIENAPISETEKLILTCKFIRCLKPSAIYDEINESDCGVPAMRKRIKRIICKMPEPTKKRLF